MRIASSTLRRSLSVGTAVILALVAVACDPNEPGSIGDRVFLDANADGIDNNGEAGLADVAVELYDSEGALVDSTVTAGDGSYLFADVAKGDYEVAFVLPPDHAFTAANQGGDDSVDSDADPTTGRTGTITLASGGEELDHDAGAVPATSLTKTVHATANADSNFSRYLTYTFDVTVPGTIDVSLDWENPDANLNLFLRDPDNTFVDQSAHLDKPETIRYHAARTGTWKVAVKAVSGSTPFTLAVKHSPGAEAPTAQYRSVLGYKGHAGLYAYGMDWDATDNTMLVGDIWNYRVLRYTLDGDLVGVVSTTAPGGELGGILDPFDVEAAPNGDVWVANQAQSRIVQFDHDGNWIKTIGRGGGPEPHQSYAKGCGGGGQMYWPTHLVVHPVTNNIYVTDPFCKDTVVFDYDGNFLFEFDMDLKDVGIFNPTPRGIDVDSNGDIYIAEHNGRRLIKYAPDGTRLAISDYIPELQDPRGMALDENNGVIWMVGAFRNETLKFDLDFNLLGVYTGTGGSGGASFETIRFPAVDGDGNVYIGDTWEYVVHKMDADGNALPWNTPPQPPPDGGFNQNNGIGIEPSTGDLYVADTFENRVQRFATKNPETGEPWICSSSALCPAFELAFGKRGSPIPNTPSFNYPRGLSVGGGSVWVEATNAISEFDLDGNFLGRFGERGSAPGEFISGPRGIEVVEDSPGATTGKLYTTDVGNCRVQVFDLDGNFLDLFGGPCGKSSIEQMQGPWQLDVNDGLVYVADGGRNRVVVFDESSGEVVREITGPFDGKGLAKPRGVQVGPDGNWIYIGDSNNNRVVRESMDGTVREVVTTGVGTPEGKLGGPENIVFGPDGLMYLSDNNQRIYIFEIGA